MNKRPGATSDNGFVFRKKNREEGKKSAIRFGNNSNYPLLSTCISTWTEPDNILDKFTIHSTSYKLIWPKMFFKFHAWVKKCHFGYFSEIGRLAGLAMPC